MSYNPAMPQPERFYTTDRINKWNLQEYLKHDPGHPPDAWINERLPYSDIRNEWLLEGSVYQEAYVAFPLYRLGEIKSLSFLSFRPSLDSTVEIEVNVPFTHDRLDHSLVVAMVSEKIFRRNGYDEQTINRGIIAGLLHDIATPALGDSTKSLDPVNLHEEDHWREVIDNEGYRFLERHDVDPLEMSAIIKNQGMHGVVLDIADRITYVMKDLHHTTGFSGILSDTNFTELAEKLAKNQSIGNIYRDVHIDPDTQQVYFDDPARLFDFLELRGLLHFSLYQNPLSAGRDALVSHFLEPFYTPGQPTKDRPLTPSRLREMTDRELMIFLSEQYGRHPASYDFFYNDMSAWNPKFEQFASVGEANKRRAQMRDEPDTLPLDIIVMKGFDPGTDYLVRADDGTIVPFKDAYPQRAMMLREMSEETKGIYLFYTDLFGSTALNEVVHKVFSQAR